MDLARIVNKEPQSDVLELEAIRDVMNFQISKLNNRRESYSLQHYFFLVSVACYHYGIMQGKRIERARRNEKAAYGRGHVVGGEAQDLPQKKSEQFQYIPPCPPRKETKQEEWSKFVAAQAALKWQEDAAAEMKKRWDEYRANNGAARRMDDEA